MDVNFYTRVVQYEKSYYICTILKGYDMKTATLTEEYDLIMAIRNYKKSYPDGYPEILWYIERLFNELLDCEDEK